MNRRQLILTLGAGSTVVVGAATGGWAWREIASRSSLPGVFDATHRATLDVLSEALLPRTQTPGARDVGVAAWIEFVVSKAFREADRQQFLQGLHAIDRFAHELHGDPVARLPAASVEQLIHALDAPGRVTAAQIRLQGMVARRVDVASALGQLTASVAEAPRAFLTVKDLVLHGYFTSETVQREVLRLQWA